MRDTPLQAAIQGGQPTAYTSPKKLVLQAIDEKWPVIYRFNKQQGISLKELKSQQLLVEGLVNDGALCQRILRRWLVSKGKRHLVPWLHALAQEHGFSYNRVQIRCQKTRWGSCSSLGTISLNAKLLFLPPELTEYVLIHELCHTVHLNHSQDFWHLVGQYEPDLPQRRQQMRTALQYVPAWLR